MKKISLLFLFLLIVSASFGQRFEAGLLGGLNASQVEGDSFRGYHKAGIVLGGFVQRDLTDKTYAGMEIKYSQKGSRKNPDPKDIELKKYIMRLGYMDVPFYLGYRTSERISILGGLSAGFLVHSGEWDNYGKFQKPDQRPFNNFDLQAFLGGRYLISDKFSFDIRFAYSFIPVRNLPGDRYWYWLDNQYNNVISSCIYYTIGR